MYMCGNVANLSSKLTFKNLKGKTNKQCANDIQLTAIASRSNKKYRCFINQIVVTNMTTVDMHNC